MDEKQDNNTEPIEITKARSRVTAKHATPFQRYATTPQTIVNILVKMKLDNRSDYSINFTRKALNTISKHADLTKPEEVRMFLALLKTSNGYKRNLAIAYNKYAKYYKIEWEMPRYKPEAKNIALPTREKIQMLIANSG